MYAFVIYWIIPQYNEIFSDTNDAAKSGMQSNLFLSISDIW